MHGMLVDLLPLSLSLSLAHPFHFQLLANILWKMAKTAAIFRISIRWKIVHKLSVRCYVYLPILMLVWFHLVWFKQSHMSAFNILFLCQCELKKNEENHSRFRCFSCLSNLCFPCLPMASYVVAHFLRLVCTILCSANEVIASVDFCINYFWSEYKS